MATVNVAFNTAMQGSTPVVGAVPTASAAITSSGTSQQTSITAGNDTACRITAIGGSVWIKFGANPTAAAGSDYLIPSGASHDFGNIPAGYKVAVIDAA